MARKKRKRLVRRGILTATLAATAAAVGFAAGRRQPKRRSFFAPKRKGIAQTLFRRNRLATARGRFLFFRANPVGRALRPFAQTLGI